MAKKQAELPGFERQINKAVEPTAEAFITCRYERLELQRKEKDLQAQLLALLKDQKLKAYTYADGDHVYPIEVSKDVKERLKTSRKSIHDDASEGEDDE